MTCTMDATRDLRPWEYYHAKRMHVYKFPESCIPSTRSLTSPALEGLSDTASKDTTAQLLAKKYYEFTAAHNDRNFDSSAEPWCSVAPVFSFEVAFGAQQHMKLAEYLELGKQMFGGDPSLRVEVQDVSIQIDPVAGVAEVFANQALVSPQLTRRSVCVMEYVKLDGEWRVAGGKNIKGDDGI